MGLNNITDISLEKQSAIVYMYTKAQLCIHLTISYIYIVSALVACSRIIAQEALNKVNSSTVSCSSKISSIPSLPITAGVDAKFRFLRIGHPSNKNKAVPSFHRGIRRELVQ